MPVQRLHCSSTGAVQGSQVMPLNLPSHSISQGGKACQCGAGRQLHPDHTSHLSLTQCDYTVATSPQPQPSPAHPSLARGGQQAARVWEQWSVVPRCSMVHTHTHTALMPGLHGSSQAKLHPIPWFAPQAPAGCHSRSCRRRHYVSFA